MSLSSNDVKDAAASMIDELNQEIDARDASALLIGELDQEEELYKSSPPPRFVPPRSPVMSEPSAGFTPHHRSLVLHRLLAMADTYSKEGSLRQAVEMYFEIVREHAGTPQAFQAEERLIGVARAYEESGELKQARGIYEQLL